MAEESIDSSNSSNNFPSVAPATIITLAIVGALLFTIIGTAVYKLCKRPDPDGNVNVLDRAADRPKSQEERMEQVRKINRRHLRRLGFEARAELRHALYVNERYSKFSSTTDDGYKEDHHSRYFDEVDIGAENQTQPFDFGFQRHANRASTIVTQDGRYSSYGNPWVSHSLFLSGLLFSKS